MKSHDVLAPRLIAAVAILVLIATHVVLLRVFSRAQLSLAFLAGLISPQPRLSSCVFGSAMDGASVAFTMLAGTTALPSLAVVHQRDSALIASTRSAAGLPSFIGLP